MTRTRAAALLLAVLVAAPLAAQDDPRSIETTTLRQAAVLENRGLLAESETALRRLLDSQPSSVAALFALERVARAQAHPIVVLPYAARFLDVDPSSAGVRYLNLRLLAEVDSLAALVRETEAWIERAPGDPAPYRDAAALYERAFGAERALDLLRRGRTASRIETALALEIGDLQLRAGRVDDAAAEWARSTVSGGGGEALLRRLGQIDDRSERERLVAALLAALERPPSTAAGRAVGVRIGLGFGRVDEAFARARALAPALTGPARQTFLEDVTRWGDGSETPNVSLWALEALREGQRGEAGRELDRRIARTALEAGDTAASVAASARLAEALPRGAVERRRALADLIRVEAGRAAGDAPADRLRAFQEEFPEAPELDELAAAVSSGLQSRGESSRAAEVIAQVQGPRSALERAYLLLADGDVAGGRAALMESVAGLAAARATDAIQLASLLGRLSPPGAAAVAQAAVDAHRGKGREAGLTLERAAAQLAPADRPLALAEAARLTSATGAEADAARIHAALVAGYPDTSEAAEAALDLARWHARTPQGVAAAIRLLEDLIVRAPTSAVAPAARRELDRLRRGA